MYNTPYFNNTMAYNQQANIDRINNQIAELEKMKAQIPPSPISNGSQPAINQTFQLAPNNQSSIRYVNSYDDVQKEFVVAETPFFSKDLSVLWIKNAKGDIKSYELNEIIKKDERDLKIEFLQAQIEELKKGLNNNEQSIDAVIDESAESKKSTNVSKGRTVKK